MLYDLINEIRKRGITAYRLAKESEGRISVSNAHRIMSGDVDDVRLQTALVMAKVAGFRVVLEEQENEDATR